MSDQIFASSLYVHADVDIHRPGFFLMMPTRGDAEIHDQVEITDGPFETQEEAEAEAELVVGERYVMWLGGLDSGVTLQ